MLPLIGYDPGPPESVSIVVGYLLQASIASRIMFCFIKVGTGFCRACYVKSVSGKWSQTFDAADTGQDGRIDRLEWITYFGDIKGFDAYNINHDGSVSHAEFLAYQRALRQNARKLDVQDDFSIDPNYEFDEAVENDDRIDRQEWIAHFGDDTKFDLCDVSHEGSVTCDEFLAYAASDPDEDNGVNREEWIAQFGNDDRFDEPDVDNDGFISRAEFLATLATRFTAIRTERKNKPVA